MRAVYLRSRHLVTVMSFHFTGLFLQQVNEIEAPFRRWLYIQISSFRLLLNIINYSSGMPVTISRENSLECYVATRYWMLLSILPELGFHYYG